MRGKARGKGDVPHVYLLFFIFVRRAGNAKKALGMICYGLSV